MKKKKVGMIGVISNPVKSLNSHNGGWTYVCKSIIDEFFNCEIDILNEKDDWERYDILIINEGVNYKQGVYNFFGGVSEGVKIRLNKLNSFKGELFCINEDIDYNDVCLKRKELIDFRNISFKKPNIFELSNCFNKLILGDSHSISVYKPGYSISRNDGKTLHGFLNEGISNYVESYTDELVFYAGNIDVRFHISRYGIKSIDSMILELEKQLKELNLRKITLVHLLPIENESRKIPGTGKYKGNNFNGTRLERLDMVVYFNKMIDIIANKNGWNVIKWDFDYNKELNFDNMEAKQSVHLRPTSYKFASRFINLPINTLF